MTKSWTRRMQRETVMILFGQMRRLRMYKRQEQMSRKHFFLVAPSLQPPVVFSLCSLRCGTALLKRLYQIYCSSFRFIVLVLIIAYHQSTCSTNNSLR